MKIKRLILLLTIVMGSLGACVERESTPLSPAVRPTAGARSGSSPFTSGSAPPQASIMKLTDAAYRCILTVTDAPAKMRPGETLNLGVLITNGSPETWPKFQPTNPAQPAVNLAYHWVNPVGDKTLVEGDRAFLAENLAPGASARIDMKILGFTEPGTYILRVEPLYEGVAWFSSKGGCKFESKVNIAP